MFWEIFKINLYLFEHHSFFYFLYGWNLYYFNFIRAYYFYWKAIYLGFKNFNLKFHHCYFFSIRDFYLSRGEVCIIDLSYLLIGSYLFLALRFLENNLVNWGIFPSNKYFLLYLNFKLLSDFN